MATSHSVLSSFGVVLMSCKVNFPVVRSALLRAGTQGGTPTFPRLKKKYIIVILLVCDLMKLGAHGSPG